MSEEKLRDAIDAHEASRQLGFEQGTAAAIAKVRKLLERAHRNDATGDPRAAGEISALEELLGELGADPDV